MVTPPMVAKPARRFQWVGGRPVQRGGLRLGRALGPGYPHWSTRRNHHDATESLASLHHPRLRRFARGALVPLAGGAAAGTGDPGYPPADAGQQPPGLRPLAGHDARGHRAAGRTHRPGGAQPGHHQRAAFRQPVRCEAAGRHRAGVGLRGSDPGALHAGWL